MMCIHIYVHIERDMYKRSPRRRAISKGTCCRSGGYAEAALFQSDGKVC